MSCPRFLHKHKKNMIDAEGHQPQDDQYWVVMTVTKCFKAEKNKPAGAIAQSSSSTSSSSTWPIALNQKMRPYKAMLRTPSPEKPNEQERSDEKPSDNAPSDEKPSDEKPSERPSDEQTGKSQRTRG